MNVRRAGNGVGVIPIGWNLRDTKVGRRAFHALVGASTSRGYRIICRGEGGIERELRE